MTGEHNGKNRDIEGAKRDKRLYIQLFMSTFSLSAFTFGGGYVIVPLMKKRFVDRLGWLDEDEMLNLITLAQSSPGAVAVNTSMLVGRRMAGLLGMLVATLGTVLPPLITLSVISLFYTAFRDNIVVNAVLKGMQAGVAAVIADVVASLGAREIKQVISALIMAGVFCASFFFKVNVVYIILVCGSIGAVRVWLGQKRRDKS